MRRVRHVRYLAAGEKRVAQDVFRSSLPYDEIVISDGLGYNDREFTVPTSLPISLLFNVKDGKWVIHAGDGYYGMSKFQSDKNTLIHELTHVWQGEHSTKSWHVAAKSLWHQALSDDAYEYDHNYYLNWDDYNPEQQASIVEHWFAEGMKTARAEDIRFYYIKRYIWREKVDYDWIADSHTIKPLPAATLKVFIVDPILLPILQPRFRPDDVHGYGNRAKRLEEIFLEYNREYAQYILPRLEHRKGGDKVSEYFYDNLSTPLREKLLDILRRRLTYTY